MIVRANMLAETVGGSENHESSLTLLSNHWPTFLLPTFLFDTGLVRTNEVIGGSRTLRNTTDLPYHPFLTC